MDKAMKPFRVECQQEIGELSLRFSCAGQSIWVRGATMMDGTTLERLREQVEQAGALYRAQREACGCGQCLAGREELGSD